MTPPLWATPKTRLFVAARLARRFGGEVIDTLVDNHADMPADVETDADETERKGGFR